MTNDEDKNKITSVEHTSTPVILNYYDLYQVVLESLKKSEQPLSTTNIIEKVFNDLNIATLNKREQNKFKNKVKKAVRHLKKSNVIAENFKKEWVMTEKGLNINDDDIVDLKRNAIKDELYTGISIAVSLLLTSIFLFFNPQYLVHEIAARILALVLAVFGVFGLGFELNKIRESERSLGFDNLGLGVGIIVFLINSHNN